MIFSFLFVLVGIIISIFAFVLSFFQWLMPPQIPAAITTFFDVMHAFSGFLPFLTDITGLFILIVPVAVIKYAFNVILWLWSLVPWIGNRTSAPRGHNVARDMANKKFYID